MGANYNHLFDHYEITPEQLNDWIITGVDFSLLDVRNEWELEKASFETYQHIPLASLSSSIFQINTEKPIIVVCHHGKRSIDACFYLRSQGMAKTLSLKGGIDLWADTINPSIGKY